MPRYGRTRRLSGQGAFQHLFRQGKTLREDWLSLVILENGLSITRFGCTVRRATAPAGVFRNRLKRWLREAFRQEQARFPEGFDMVAVIGRVPAAVSFTQVKEQLLRLTRRIRSASPSS